MEQLEDRHLLAGCDRADFNVSFNNIFDLPSSRCFDAVSTSSLIISADGKVNGQHLTFDSDDDGVVDKNQTASIITSIDVKGSFGADTIDLSAVSLEAFPNLRWRGGYQDGLDARQQENAWYEFAPVRILGDNDDITDLSPTSGGDDMIIGSDFDDTIYSQIGSNTVLGGLGEDFIVSGTGDDILSGQQDNDWFFYGNPLDVGLLDIPLLDFSGDSDRIFGGSGDDRLIVAKHALPGDAQASNQAFLVDTSEDGTRITQSAESPFDLFLGEIESAEIRTRALLESKLTYAGSTPDFGHLLYDGIGSQANHDFVLALKPQDEMAINVLVNKDSTNVADIDATDAFASFDDLQRMIEIDESLDRQYGPQVFGGDLVVELTAADVFGNETSSVATFSKVLSDAQPLQFMRVFGSDAVEEYSIDTVYRAPSSDPDVTDGIMTPLIPSLVIDGNDNDLSAFPSELDTFTVLGEIHPSGDDWQLTGPVGFQSHAIQLNGQLEGGNFSINASDAASFHLQPLGLFNDTSIDASTVGNFRGELSIAHDSLLTASNDVIVVASESENALQIENSLPQDPVDVIFARQSNGERRDLIRIDKGDPGRTRPAVVFDVSGSEANVAVQPESVFGREIRIGGNDRTTRVQLEGSTQDVNAVFTEFLNLQTTISVDTRKEFSGRPAPRAGIIEVTDVAVLEDFVGENLTSLLSIGSDQEDSVSARVDEDGLRVDWGNYPDSVFSPSSLVNVNLAIATGGGVDNVTLESPLNAEPLTLPNGLAQISIDGGEANDILVADYESSFVAATILGGEGNDEIIAVRGDSSLFGEAGNDTIQDGIHNNRIIGGEGQDTYVMNPFAQRDGQAGRSHDEVSIEYEDVLDFSIESNPAIQINLDSSVRQIITDSRDTIRLFGRASAVPPEVSQFIGSRFGDQITVAAVPSFANASKSTRLVSGDPASVVSFGEDTLTIVRGDIDVTLIESGTNGTVSTSDFQTNYASIENIELRRSGASNQLESCDLVQYCAIVGGSLGALRAIYDPVNDEVVLQGGSFESDIGTVVNGELRIPVDQIPSGMLAFEGSENDESLTLDFSGGNLPVAFRFLGNGGSDALSVVGGNFGDSELTYSNATAGRLVVDGLEATFVGVESLDLSETGFQNLDIRIPAALPVTDSTIGSDEEPTLVRSFASGSGTLSFVNPSGTLDLFNDGINEPPTINNIPPQIVEEGNELTFTAVGEDPDGVLGTVSYLLPTPPLGAFIDPVTGVFRWTPSERQGPGTYEITVRVRDTGLPVQFADTVVSVEVTDSTPFQNSQQVQDVNIDGSVTALDALIIINFLRRVEVTTLSRPANPSLVVNFVDVDGNNEVSARDALLVINFLPFAAEASGEQVVVMLPTSPSDDFIKSDDDEMNLLETHLGINDN